MDYRSGPRGREKEMIYIEFYSFLNNITQLYTNLYNLIDCLNQLLHKFYYEFAMHDESFWAIDFSTEADQILESSKRYKILSFLN